MFAQLAKEMESFTHFAKMKQPNYCLKSKNNSKITTRRKTSARLDIPFYPEFAEF